jgi:hypothetical protein
MPTQERGPQADAKSKSGQVRELLATGMSAADIAKKVGCTRGLVYVIKSTSRNKGGATKRGPGRRRKVASKGKPSMDGLAGILDMVKNGERERAQLRAAIERIQALVTDALA